MRLIPLLNLLFHGKRSRKDIFSLDARCVEKVMTDKLFMVCLHGFNGNTFRAFLFAALAEHVQK